MRTGSAGRFRLLLFNHDGLRLVFIERSPAFSAKVVIGPKLDEMAMVASNYFPGVNRGQGCRHVSFSELARAGSTPENVLPECNNWGSVNHVTQLVNLKIQAKPVQYPAKQENKRRNKEENHDQSRLGMEPDVRIDSIGEFAQAHAGGGSLHARLCTQIRRRRGKMGHHRPASRL